MHINAVLDMDVVALEQDDTITVMLDLTAPQVADSTDRPPQAAIVVLDRSGSMSGDRLDAGKRALIDLVNRLDDRDWLGVVTFDDQAQVVIPAMPVAAIGREVAKQTIAAIHTGGSTDLSSGYLRGLQEARRAQADGGATVLVLSDGHANTGIVDPAAFRQMAAGAAPHRITTSSIGIGLGYDEAILADLAVGGSGNHTFAEEADAAAAAVAEELEGLLSKTVQAASVLIKPTGDVASMHIVNDLPTHGTPSGVMLELGDFYAGEQRKVLVTFEVPAMAALGLAQIADLEVTYVSVPELVTHTVNVPVTVNVVPEDVAKGRVPDPEVRREKLLLDVQAAKRRSEEALRRGDESTAQQVMLDTIEVLTSSQAADFDPEVDDEIRFIQRSVEGLDRRGGEFTGKLLRADGSKKSRGFKNRAQGGDRSFGPADDEESA